MDDSHDVITRSEEELEVGIRSRVTGRVRLRKRIVTETVQVSVDVRREELEVVREDLAGEVFEGDFAAADDAFTIVLSAEEPVVDVRVVPVERVHVTKELVTEQRVVSADLRSEQVELEESPPIR